MLEDTVNTVTGQDGDPAGDQARTKPAATTSSSAYTHGADRASIRDEGGPTNDQDGDRCGRRDRHEDEWEDAWRTLREARRQYPGFRGASLLRDSSQPTHYLVLSEWDGHDQLAEARTKLVEP